MAAVSELIHISENRQSSGAAAFQNRQLFAYEFGGRDDQAGFETTFEHVVKAMGPAAIAKALKIGRASVYRVLERH